MNGTAGHRSSRKLRERPPEALRGVGRTYQPRAGGYGRLCWKTCGHGSGTVLM